MNSGSHVLTDRARELTIFAVVVDQGSFSNAARVLGLSPSAISRAIDRIEARLGVRLLHRTTRSLTLSAEGQAYLQAARRILKDLDDSEQQIADQGSPRGLLRVSASLSHGRLHVVPLLPEFAALYPHIQVDISLTDTTIDISGGQADVAIRFGKLPDSNLTARKLGVVKRVVAASPDYLTRFGTPKRPEDLLDHNCLHFNFFRAESSWPFLVNNAVEWIPIKGSIEANNGETLAQLAVLGMGIVRLGEFLVVPNIETGRLIPILQDFNPGDAEDVHAIFVGGSHTPARVRAFVDFLAERLSNRM